MEFIFARGTSPQKFYPLQLKSCCDCHTVLILTSILTRRNTCVPQFISVEHSEMSMLRVLEAKERTATP